MTPAGLLWAASARLAAPLLPFYLRRRAARGKELAGRMGERRGEDATRPPGPLLWVHAASVGETLSALPLIEALAASRPSLRFLVTTGTVTAAELLLLRVPDALRGRVLHRFAPLDVPGWAASFLDGWRPDAAAFVESELWPNLLAAARARGLPMGLVNARMSPRSARTWGFAPGLAREVLGSFRLVLAQSGEDAARLLGLGAPAGGATRAAGNLKYAAPPLPVDAAELARLRGVVGERPVLLAASTHPGEEAVVADAHARLAAGLPDLLTVIVPRHPGRGEALAGALADVAGGPPPRRALGQDPPPGCGLFLADTLGELGLFYRLAGVAVVGRSLLPPGGGQNPLEPARLGCPVLLGPHVGNFAAVAARLLAAGGAVPVPGEGVGGAVTAAALADAAAAVLTDPARAAALRAAAAGIADDAAGLAEAVAVAVATLLPASGRPEEPGKDESGASCVPPSSGAGTAGESRPCSCPPSPPSTPAPRPGAWPGPAGAPRYP